MRTSRTPRRSTERMTRRAAPGRRSSGFQSVSINTYADLLRHEPAILQRIADMPNGGNLFMAHPFQLLADIGVVLSKEVQRQILKWHPELSGLSLVPYEAVKAAGAQSVRYRIRGLFRRQKP